MRRFLQCTFIEGESEFISPPNRAPRGRRNFNVRNWRMVEAGSSAERMALSLLPTLVGVVAFAMGFTLMPGASSLVLALVLTLLVAWGLSRAGAESALVRELRARSGLVLKHAPVVVWSVDQAGMYTSLQGQGLKELRLDPERVIGKNYFVINRDHPELLQPAERALAGAAFTAEMPVLDRWFSTTYLPLQKEGVSAGFMAVSFDVTERVAAEHEARAAREELEAALEAREDFLVIASHELKTPLTTLKLRSQTMRRWLDQHDERGLEPAKIRTLVDQIDKQTSRLGRLVEDMLDMSRLRSGKLTLETAPQALQKIVGEAVERIRPQYEAAGCDLSFTAPPDPLTVCADELRIEQVVTNFLTNALRYGRGRPVRVEVKGEDQSALVRVIDQGMGVAPQDQRKIFRRFERAVSANEISGLGLGLYISEQIAVAHGGEIRLQSQLDKGSTFELRLPLDPAIPASLAPPDLQATA